MHALIRYSLDDTNLTLGLGTRYYEKEYNELELCNATKIINKNNKTI